MWHLTKIPKIAHFYWGNNRLPYLRYLTVYSFHKQNPDWEIRFYYPKYPYAKNTWRSHEQKYTFTGKNYYSELKKLPIKFIEMDMVSLGLRNDISEVHKSDYLRWYLLSTIGGLWSDMDIIYFKPMNNLVNNKEKNKHIDTLVSIQEEEFHRKILYHQSIGFMLSSPNNTYYSKIWKLSKKFFNPNNYQCLGILLSQKCGITIKEILYFFKGKLNIQNIPAKVVYPFSSRKLGLIYNSRDIRYFTNDSIGLHWYAGHPVASSYVKTITGENFLVLTNILGTTIRKALV